MYCSSLNAHLPRAHSSSVSGMTPICAAASASASVAELHAMRSMLTSDQSGNREQMTRILSVGYRMVRRASAGRHVVAGGAHIHPAAGRGEFTFTPGRIVRRFTESPRLAHVNGIIDVEDP